MTTLRLIYQLLSFIKCLKAVDKRPSRKKFRLNVFSSSFINCFINLKVDILNCEGHRYFLFHPQLTCLIVLYIHSHIYNFYCKSNYHRPQKKSFFELCNLCNVLAFLCFFFFWKKGVTPHMRYTVRLESRKTKTTKIASFSILQ